MHDRSMDDLEEESALVRGLATLPRALRRTEDDLSAGELTSKSAGGRPAVQTRARPWSMLNDDRQLA